MSNLAKKLAIGLLSFLITMSLATTLFPIVALAAFIRAIYRAGYNKGNELLAMSVGGALLVYAGQKVLYAAVVLPTAASFAVLSAIDGYKNGITAGCTSFVRLCLSVFGQNVSYWEGFKQFISQNIYPLSTTPNETIPAADPKGQFFTAVAFKLMNVDADALNKGTEPTPSKAETHEPNKSAEPLLNNWDPSYEGLYSNSSHALYDVDLGSSSHTAPNSWYGQVR